MSNFDENSQTPPPPPSGDSKKAEKYISRLIELINEDKLNIVHTDLKKFDPGSLQDHYQLELSDYQVEVSHSKHPDTGKDFYNILFNNLKQIRDGCSEKTILAYMHLTSDQFQRFAEAGNEQLSRRKKEAEERRFSENIKPIDDILESLSSKEDNGVKTEENPIFPQIEESQTVEPKEETSEPTLAPAENMASPFENLSNEVSESDTSSPVNVDSQNPFVDVFAQKIDNAIEEKPEDQSNNQSLLDVFTKQNSTPTQE